MIRITTKEETMRERKRIGLINHYCELQDDYWYYYKERSDLYDLEDPRERRRAHWLTVALNAINEEKRNVIKQSAVLGMTEEVLQIYYHRFWNCRR